MTNNEHLTNCADIISKTHISQDQNLEQCYQCDREFEWKEVPRGYDEEYCDECNEEHNHYECNNCREEVDEPDTFCSEWCYKEYEYDWLTE